MRLTEERLFIKWPGVIDVEQPSASSPARDHIITRLTSCAFKQTFVTVYMHEEDFPEVVSGR